jgi:hypothetical protein
VLLGNPSLGGWERMVRESIPGVVVMHPHRAMRTLLQRELAESGYTVVYASTYAAVLRYLSRVASPVVVVAGNCKADFYAETRFFRRITADATLARRHRFVLFCVLPEWLPLALDATLRSLGVTVLGLSSLPELQEAVAVAAGRAHADQHQRGEAAG